VARAVTGSCHPAALPAVLAQLVFVLSACGPSSPTASSSSATEQKAAPARSASDTQPAALPQAPATAPAVAADSVSKQVSPSEDPGQRVGVHEVRSTGLLQLSIAPPKAGLSVAAQTAEALMAGDKPAVDAIVQAGQALYVHVETCCVDSCDRNARATCTVERTGNELRVSSLLQYESPDKTSLACPDVSDHPWAICQIPTLDAGAYTLHFAGQSLSFRVPGTLNKTILDSAAGH